MSQQKRVIKPFQIVSSREPPWQSIQLLAVVLIGLGALLLSVANRTSSPLLFVAMLTFLGIAVSRVINLRTKYCSSAYLLTFASCIFVAGCAQYNAFSNTGFPFTGQDTFTFYEVTIGPRYDILTLRQHVNAPLAIVVWRFFYDIANALGMGNGPWIGVAVNSVLVGLAASITVSIAHLSPHHFQERAFKITILSAVCGLYWLSGALFLRESFLLVVMSCLLKAFMYTIKHPTTNGHVALISTVTLSALALWHLRTVSLGMLGVFVLLFAFVSTGDIQRNQSRALSLIVGSVVLFFAAAFVVEYLGTSVEGAIYSSEVYSAGSAAEASRDSLGMRYIVNQPYPVRIILGSVYDVLFPIPFWDGLWASDEYRFIKSCHAMFFITIFPLVISGAVLTFRRFRKQDANSMLEMFVVGFAFVSLFCVAATSLENRHLAQFMNAFILLASLPRWHVVEDRQLIRQWARRWYGSVLSVYIAWVALKLV